MKISEIAAHTGVSTSALRYYESEGLLAPSRSANGYRSFTADDIDRIEFIRSAKQLGLEIPEIRELIDVTEHGSCTAVRESMRPALPFRMRLHRIAVFTELPCSLNG